MNIRLHGTPEECAQAAKRLREAFCVVSQSRQFPDRGQSALVRVYAEVSLEPAAKALAAGDGNGAAS